MNLTAEQLKMTQAILYRVRTNAELKLAWGSRIRSEIVWARSHGQKVDNYRTQWLLQTRNRVIDALIAGAEDFNQKYGHDRISTRDMADVLASALHALEIGTAKAITAKSRD